MNDLPNPLAPADCDLRDFGYMPLDVVRLRDSSLTMRATGDEFRCAVLLWCASWHQVPAGSLPDDDIDLANYAGFGRVVDAWLEVKAGAMRGWVKCADGRLYHPVVAEKASEAYEAKHRLSYDKLAERVRKRNKGRPENGRPFLDIPEFIHWMDAGRPLERDLFPAEFPSTSVGKSTASAGSLDQFQGSSSGIPPDFALKGEEGRGEEGRSKPCGSNDGVGTASRTSPEIGPIAAAEVSKSLIAWERERGKAARNMTPSQQQVIDLAAALKSLDELRKAYEYAVADREATGDPNAVNAGFVHAMLDKVRRPPRPVREDTSWKRTPAGIERKASELGVLCPPGRDHGWLLEKCESVLRQQQGVAA
ncbi:YdaU family protein [Burkholderia glumae]|uniref:YdaU family protein n=1 Tax=Burkholderia glumae TaxID=337 RepID=UPI0021507FB1|nr:YdaU family protein [Burkholderia glumae]